MCLRFGRSFRFWAIVLPAVVAAGCTSPADSPDSTSVSATERDAAADELLSQMFATYRQATTYADNTVVQTRFVARAEHIEHDAPPQTAAVTFSRPNQLRLTRQEIDANGRVIADCRVVSDGDRMWTAIPDFPGQVLESVAPLALGTENILESDSIRRAVLPVPLSDLYPQLEMLLSDSPQKEVLASGSPTLLDEKPHHGRRCHRVAVRGDDGERVFWIDQETHLLRRLDLPTGQIKKETDPNDELESIELWIDLRDAEIGERVPEEAFAMEIPPRAIRVRRFVPTNLGAPPSAVGKIVEDFKFTAADGTVVDRESLAGKIAVLDFWFTTCMPCKTAMPALERVHDVHRDDDRVAFLGVSIDPPNIETSKVGEQLERWGSTADLVRDPKLEAAAKFRVVVTPTVVLLGPDGKIHGYEMGGRSDYSPLDEAIGRLLAGEDVAQTVLDAHRARRKQFEKDLSEAAVDRGDLVVEVTPAEIAAKSEPEKHTLVPLWKAEGIKNPGGLLAVDGPKRPGRSEPPGPGSAGSPETSLANSIFVIDGDRTVVELSLAGKEIARHALTLPQDAAISFLRTAERADGKRLFVASGAGRRQLHLFDDRWKPLMSFPEGEHSGIADVRFADLDGNGDLEIVVGYWGDVGVQGVSLTGTRLWADRSLSQVVQIAVEPDAEGRERLWCAHSGGTIARIDQNGQLSEVRVGDRAVISLAVDDVDGDGTAARCALAFVELGQYVAIGLDDAGQEQWSYALPPGEYRSAADRIVPVQLPGGGGWALPAADGSVHLLTSTGQLVDRFNHGSAIRGLVITHAGAEPVLLISDEDGLRAWKLVPKDQS